MVLSTLFESGSLLFAVSYSRLAAFLDSPFCLLSPSRGMLASLRLLWYLGSGDLNSGPRACVSALHHQTPSPAPLFRLQLPDLLLWLCNITVFNSIPNIYSNVSLSRVTLFKLVFLYFFLRSISNLEMKQKKSEENND